MKTRTLLKSTKEEVHIVPYSGQGAQPWTHEHERVLFTYPNGKHRTQVVKKFNLRTIKD